MICQIHLPSGGALAMGWCLTSRRGTLVTKWEPLVSKLIVISSTHQRIVTIGNGKTTLFWSSTWINGTMAKNNAPPVISKNTKEKDQGSTGHGK
jgi:hypothetical protein